MENHSCPLSLPKTFPLPSLLYVLNLQEDGRTLDEYGIKAGARLLVMRGAASPAVADLAAQEKAAAAAVEHAQRLERLKRSAEALAGRGNGR